MRGRLRWRRGVGRRCQGCHFRSIAICVGSPLEHRQRIQCHGDEKCQCIHPLFAVGRGQSPGGSRATWRYDHKLNLDASTSSSSSTDLPSQGRQIRLRPHKLDAPRSLGHLSRHGRSGRTGVGGRDVKVGANRGRCCGFGRPDFARDSHQRKTDERGNSPDGEHGIKPDG